MPIKSKEDIYNFFEKNIGKEFIHFQNKEYDIKNNEKFNKFHLFPYWSRSRYKKIFRKIESILLKLQRMLKVNRIKNNNIQFQKGAQWFSITNDFANYVLSKEKWVKSTFKYTYCCDEIFLQTLIINSNFKKNLYSKNFDDNHITLVRRYIDWKRGNPYIFRKEDFKDLINSKALFARKFDLKVDKEIIDLIFKKVLLTKK